LGDRTGIMPIKNGCFVDGDAVAFQDLQFGDRRGIVPVVVRFLKLHICRISKFNFDCVWYIVIVLHCQEASAAAVQSVDMDADTVEPPDSIHTVTASFIVEYWFDSLTGFHISVSSCSCTVQMLLQNMQNLRKV